jgi:hypothetical protein
VETISVSKSEWKVMGFQRLKVRCGVMALEMVMLQEEERWRSMTARAKAQFQLAGNTFDVGEVVVEVSAFPFVVETDQGSS